MGIFGCVYVVGLVYLCVVWVWVCAYLWLFDMCVGTIMLVMSERKSQSFYRFMFVFLFFCSLLLALLLFLRCLLCLVVFVFICAYCLCIDTLELFCVPISYGMRVCTCVYVCVYMCLYVYFATGATESSGNN